MTDDYSQHHIAYLPVSNQNQIEGKRRFWVTEPNILAEQRGLGSDLLSSTTWSFQGEKDVASIEKTCVAGSQGGFCGPWGELETDLRCSWAGGKSHNIINKNKNNQKFVPFERLTSCQLKDSLPLHEPWHSDLPNFLRLVIIIHPPCYQNNDTIFLNISSCKILVQMRRSLHFQVVINILRPDKMSELLDAFISDHLGWLSLPSRCLQDSLPDVCKRIVINL